MKYLYRCRNHHVESPVRQESIVCDVHSGLNTDVLATRDLHAELCSQHIVNDDPFRRAYLGSALEKNLVEQQRPLDHLAPKDKFEAKAVERATGRIYIGDNTEMLSQKAQRAIAKGKRGEYPNEGGGR